MSGEQNYIQHNWRMQQLLHLVIMVTTVVIVLSDIVKSLKV